MNTSKRCVPRDIRMTSKKETAQPSSLSPPSPPHIYGQPRVQSPDKMQSRAGRSQERLLWKLGMQDHDQD